MAEPEGGGIRIEYDEYVRLIRQLDELVAGFQNEPDEAIRERVLALLGGIDMLHRAPLHRLVHGLREHGAGSTLDRVAADPVIETLLGLYDLAELDVPEEAEPAANVTFVPRDRLSVGRPGRGAG